MPKKWYNYFVSTDIDPAPKQAEDTGGNAAQAIADIAASVELTQPPAASLPNSASFEEVYRAAEIPQPAHGYTIFKVAQMLQSDHIRNLPAEVKRSSVLLALEAAGVKLPEIIEDAVRRDKALDTFELVQQRSVEGLEASINEENKQIQAEMDRLVAEHRARIESNNKRAAAEKERFYQWRLKKQEEEQKIFDAVSHFAVQNPVTR